MPIWIYIALLLAGGLIGYLKAGSKASLVASSIFAIVLILCQQGMVPIRYATEGVLVILLVFFSIRYSKGKKFMPAGLMIILTAITLVLRFVR